MLALSVSITIGDTEASIQRLVEAFATLAGAPPRRHRSTRWTSLIRRRGCRRGAGNVAARGVLLAITAIPLDQSSGEISTELVIPYPPGIPVLAPGEVITDEKVAYLGEGIANGMYISGRRTQSCGASVSSSDFQTPDRARSGTIAKRSAARWIVSARLAKQKRASSGARAGSR